MDKTGRLLLSLCVCTFGVIAEKEEGLLYGTFPDGFIWAAATSAYQIEGGWNASGKGVNIWDTFTHEGRADKGATGDVACDSYNKYLEDVLILKDMKVTHYRFSLSWARILSDGTKNTINQAGIDYYNNVINALIEADIKPIVTLYHADLPQALADIGGMLNDSFVGYFADYAKIAFDKFGDRVKLWMTFNEPFTCLYGYGLGYFAPGVIELGSTPYKCAHVVLKAHGKAWRTYDREFRAKQKGRITFNFHASWYEPKNPSEKSDIEAAERAMQFELGWFANPIFNGDYPEVMRAKVHKNSMAQGFSESRLPKFTKSEIDMIKGTYDFFSTNFYTGRYVNTDETRPLQPPSYENDKDITQHTDPSWKTTGSHWLFGVPWGMRKLLVWVKQHYDNPEIFIAENGMSDRNGTLDDTHRVWWYEQYINNVLKAHKIDGCRVIGYTAWSLMDNFEWTAGYEERFGLHYVNFSDPARPRIPKKSAFFYRGLIEANGFRVTVNGQETNSLSLLIAGVSLIIIFAVNTRVVFQ